VDGEPAAAATEVTLELRQVLTGFFPRFGGHMVKRAAATTLDEALDGLERISA
jgi:ethanolamine utilization microcompartment shell protein EutS